LVRNSRFAKEFAELLLGKIGENLVKEHPEINSICNRIGSLYSVESEPTE
jgi:hypothetical protein